jgi:predicted cupin superfamily sugar epimerase
MENQRVQYWVDKLQLEPHPEGGFYKENYRSSISFPAEEFGLSTSGQREIATSIYFLLPFGNNSRFHRLAFDELWYFHDGDPISVHTLIPEKGLVTYTLGLNPEENQHLSCLIPAQTIFGAEVSTKDGFALVSCVVSPGFNFQDFEMLHAKDLIEAFPQEKNIIEQLNP